MFIAPAAQPVNQGFRNILDHRKPACHVPVEGGVAHRHFAFITGGQHQPAELVGESHHHIAPDARLEVLLGHAGLGIFKKGLQHFSKSAVGRLYRRSPNPYAQVVGQLLRVGHAALRGVAGRHSDSHHVFGAQSINRYRGRKSGVDASR